ncbi:hypothetical protein RFI_15068 [Reticulomyxa filosa]|uniref:Uncharacterized protein n=1 Tax=Reticulomyxa filosa TaxID=46433 RepID=X6NA06_RETFI|nr:hypothetical protein RFI_15068 [Reticulomyxa filosa]|eukprot:ETO22137.1 hypothetical protein RFI_15068 [Reticulomyxa filosa]
MHSLWSSRYYVVILFFYFSIVYTFFCGKTIFVIKIFDILTNFSKSFVKGYEDTGLKQNNFIGIFSYLVIISIIQWLTSSNCSYEYAKTLLPKIGISEKQFEGVNLQMTNSVCLWIELLLCSLVNVSIVIRKWLCILHVRTSFIQQHLSIVTFSLFSLLLYHLLLIVITYNSRISILFGCVVVILMFGHVWQIFYAAVNATKVHMRCFLNTNTTVFVSLNCGFSIGWALLSGLLLSNMHTKKKIIQIILDLMFPAFYQSWRLVIRFFVHVFNITTINLFLCVFSLSYRWNNVILCVTPNTQLSTLGDEDNESFKIKRSSSLDGRLPNNKGQTQGEREALQNTSGKYHKNIIRQPSINNSFDELTFDTTIDLI